MGHHVWRTILRENLLSLRKLRVVVAVAVFVALYIGLDLGRYFSLDAPKAHQAALAQVNWYCLSPSRLYFVANGRGFGHPVPNLGWR